MTPFLRLIPFQVTSPGSSLWEMLLPQQVCGNTVQEQWGCKGGSLLRLVDIYPSGKIALFLLLQL